MNNQQFARLSCLISANNKVVVIFRRGPSKWTQMILWDLNEGRFKEGQWFYGKVYPQKSDISFDGKLVAIALAKYSLEDFKDYYSWTTISKPPYFTSLLTLFEKEGQARGGFFENEDVFIFNGDKEQVKAEGVWSPNKMAIEYRNSPSSHMSIFGEDPLNERRLTKNGWITEQEWKGDYRRTTISQIKVKKVNSRLSILMEREVNNFNTSTTYYIKQNDSTSLIKNASWMDLDYKNRLLMAKEGKLYISKKPISSKEEISFNELLNTNDLKPSDVVAPEDYKKW